MRNADQWLPSKFVLRRGKLIGSRDPRQLNVASRLVADAVAHRYSRYIKDHCRGRLIDLGCGQVPLYGVYRDYVDKTVCVDWPSTRHDNRYVDCYCDLSQPLPFADGRFDTIILSDVLEHVPQPEQLWHEMFRILQPGGKCLINVPFYYWLHERPYDFFRYTDHALRRFAQQAGFDVIALETVGGTPEILTDLLSKHLALIPWIGNILAAALQAFTKGFIATRLGNRVSTTSSTRFPLGYFLIVEKTPSRDGRGRIAGQPIQTATRTAPVHQQLAQA